MLSTEKCCLAGTIYQLTIHDEYIVATGIPQIFRLEKNFAMQYYIVAIKNTTMKLGTWPMQFLLFIFLRTERNAPSMLTCLQFLVSKWVTQQCNFNCLPILLETHNSPQVITECQLQLNWTNKMSMTASGHKTNKMAIPSLKLLTFWHN